MRPKTRPRCGTLSAMARWLGFAMATLVLVYLSPHSAAAAGQGDQEAQQAAEQRLIEVYTPRLMLRERDEVCDTDGE